MIATLLTFLADTSAPVQTACPEGDNCVTGLPKVQLGSDQLHIILSIVFGALAGIAVIMIIIAGLKYVTESGDPQEMAKARMTIIYSVVGLLLSVSAELIVAYVLNRL